MLKGNEHSTKNEANIKETFAFRFVGLLVSHDKRFFETLNSKLTEWMPFIVTHEWFNNKQERESFFELMEVLNELSTTTSNLTEEEINQEFKQILNLMGLKKESEVQHA